MTKQFDVNNLTTVYFIRRPWEGYSGKAWTAFAHKVAKVTKNRVFVCANLGKDANPEFGTFAIDRTTLEAQGWATATRKGIREDFYIDPEEQIREWEEGKTFELSFVD